MNSGCRDLEINLYYIKTDFKDLVFKLCNQLYLKKLKTLIKLANNLDLDCLDKFLWIHKKNVFLPHLTVRDTSFGNNPILLTSNENVSIDIEKFDIIIYSPDVYIKKFENIKKKIFLFSYFTNDGNCEKNKISLSSLKYKVKTFIETNDYKWKQI